MLVVEVLVVVVVVTVVVVAALLLLLLVAVVELLVEEDVTVVGSCGDVRGSYRFKDDSSLRLFQTPPSTSFVSIMARNTDM